MDDDDDDEDDDDDDDDDEGGGEDGAIAEVEGGKGQGEARDKEKDVVKMS